MKLERNFCAFDISVLTFEVPPEQEIESLRFFTKPFSLVFLAGFFDILSIFNVGMFWSVVNFTSGRIKVKSNPAKGSLSLFALESSMWDFLLSFGRF